MINEKFFLGLPQNFKNKCYVYPPTVKDVLGNERFNAYFSLLTTSFEDIEDQAFGKDFDKQIDFTSLPMPFPLLLNSCQYSKETEALVEEAFMFFIHEPVTILYDMNAIAIGDLKKMLAEPDFNLSQLRLIREEDFFELQNLIRESIGAKKVGPPNPTENIRIKRVKAKGRYRDKLKAKSASGLKISSLISSICCMGIGINPLNIGELSYASLNELLARYQEKEKYDIDIRSLLAGADSKKIKPKYWIRNLED